jgi:DNA polymerase/3'-5' exonuclease PolX
MSDGPRLPLEVARGLADTLVELLRPGCERIEIAGSIRRERPEVGDIELLAVPRWDTLAGGLFGDIAESVNLLDVELRRLEAADGLEDHSIRRRLDKNGTPRWGERYKALTFHTVPVDLFICLPPAQWGVLYVIRTGPAEFGHALVTPQAHGGYLPSYLQVREGALRRRDTGEVVPTPEEVDVFRALGLQNLTPRAREGKVPA